MYDIEKIIAKINHQDTTYTELQNLYDNVVKSLEVSEEHRELITETIVNRIWVEFPAKAKKKFGAKDAEARELLRNYHLELEGIFDLSGNILKGGVKTGGHMINGSKFVNVYISYKNNEQYGVSLSIDQATVDSAFEFVVKKYCTKKGDKPKTRKKFGANKFREATELYGRYLREIIK